jgi:hypothetical protein
MDTQIALFADFWKKKRNRAHHRHLLQAATGGFHNGLTN